MLYIAIFFKYLGTRNRLRHTIIILLSILYPVAIGILYNVRGPQQSEQDNVLVNPCFEMIWIICFA